MEIPQRPAITAAVTRGVITTFINLGFSPLPEFPLSNGRRTDVCGLNAKGEIAITEIKSGPADYYADSKWQDYLDHCDYFYFAVAPDFPTDILIPDKNGMEPGLILADQYGGAVCRASPRLYLAPARRKAITLKFARLAALRLSASAPQMGMQQLGSMIQLADGQKVPRGDLSDTKKDCESRL